MFPESEQQPAHTAYRAISPWAVAALILGGLSASGFLIPSLTAFTIPSVVCAVVAFIRIRLYEQCGRRLILVGICFSVLFAVVIPPWHAEKYRSEAPEGVVRLDFAEVTSAKPKGADLAAYAGQRVCLKGYVYPTDQQQGITSFLLTLNGQDGPKIVFVGAIFEPPQTWNWSGHPQAVTGTLAMNPSYDTKNGTPQWVLRDCEVRPSRTPIQLASLVRGRGC